MHTSAEELFADCEFPATAEELTSDLDGREVETADGTEPAAEAIARGGGEDFESVEDATLALYSGLDGSAVGRRRYSDRDPEVPGTDNPLQRSF